MPAVQANADPDRRSTSVCSWPGAAFRRGWEWSVRQLYSLLPPMAPRRSAHGRTATLAVENDAAHNFAALRQSLPDPSRSYTDCLYTASGFFTLLKGETGTKDSTFASSGRNSSQRIASERISRGSPSCSRSATGPRHRRSYIGPWCPREYAQGSACHQNQPHADDLYTDQALI